MQGHLYSIQALVAFTDDLSKQKVPTFIAGLWSSFSSTQKGYFKKESNRWRKKCALQSAGHDGAEVVAAEAVVGVGDNVVGRREGGHLRGEGVVGLAERLGGEGRLQVDVGLGLDLLVDVGLGLHLLVDVGEDLGGGHGGADKSEEDLHEKNV